MLAVFMALALLAGAAGVLVAVWPRHAAVGSTYRLKGSRAVTVRVCSCGAERDVEGGRWSHFLCIKRYQ